MNLDTFEYHIQIRSPRLDWFTSNAFRQLIFPIISFLCRMFASDSSSALCYSSLLPGYRPPGGARPTRRKLLVHLSGPLSKPTCMLILRILLHQHYQGEQCLDIVSNLKTYVSRLDSPNWHRHLFDSFYGFKKSQNIGSTFSNRPEFQRLVIGRPFPCQDNLNKNGQYLKK